MKTAEIKIRRAGVRQPSRQKGPAGRTLRIKDILLPTDFSEPSRKALAYACEAAGQLGARLTLLYVVEPMVYADFAFMPLVMENDKTMQTAQTRLEQFAAKAGLPEKLIRQTLVRTGAPYHEITEAARTLKVDLIIISTHGRTGLSRALLGSTTERVVRLAHCPVLVIR